MGRMKDIYTETQELTERMLGSVTLDQAMELPETLGWLSPTEVAVARRALEDGDMLRALAILREAEVVTVALPMPAFATI